MMITRGMAGAVLGAVLAAGAWAQEGPRRIALTTSSAQARAQAEEAIRRIESFRPAAQIQEAARRAVEADPGFAFAHYLVAASTFPAPQARPHHDKALELVKNASLGEQRYLEALALNRAQKTADALVAFEKLAVDHPEDRMVQMMIGQLALSTGKLDQARTALERAIALEPITPRAHTFLGNVHLMKGEYAKARERYEAALARKAAGTAPGQIHYGIAYTHLYEGHPDAALKRLDAFLEEFRAAGQAAAAGANPEVFIWNSIARVNLESGKLPEALEAYEKGFGSVPGSSLQESQKKTWRGRLHHGRARTLARMGKHEDAWREAETVKKMIDEGGEEAATFRPAYHYVAGYLKLEAGDYPAAIEHLKQSEPDGDPFHKLLLARAYEKAGDKASAKKAYQEILEFRVNNLERALAYPEAKRKLGAL